MITECQSLLGIIVISVGVTVNFTADRAAMQVQLPADLALADSKVIAGVNLVSLGIRFRVIDYPSVKSPGRLFANL